MILNIKTRMKSKVVCIKELTFYHTFVITIHNILLITINQTYPANCRFTWRSSGGGGKIWTCYRYKIQWWTCLCRISRGKWLSECCDWTFGYNLRKPTRYGCILPDLLVVKKCFAIVKSLEIIFCVPFSWRKEENFLCLLKTNDFCVPCVSSLVLG